MGVGNGLTDPLVQYKFYGQLAYNWSIEVQGKPTISLEQYEQIQASIPSCISMIKECQTDTNACTNAEFICNSDMLSAYETTGQNDSLSLIVSSTQMSNSSRLGLYVYLKIHVPRENTFPGLNVYDITQKCEFPPLCYDFSDVSTFLNSPSTQKALGVKMTTWQSCNNTINPMFSKDWMKDFQKDVAQVLLPTA